MKHLLSREGASAGAVLRAPQPLLAFDFDGTLAPIVARPDDAHVAFAVRNGSTVLRACDRWRS